MSELVKATTPIKEEVWDAVSSFLGSALEKTKNVEWNIDDVRAYLDSEQGILLVVQEDDGDVSCALVCGITNYTRVKTFEIFLMGADKFTGWAKHFPEVKKLALSQGCDNIRVAGRRWVKFLSRHGAARELYQCELVL